MSEYIRDAIEVVRRKALISKARLEREREIARVAGGASFEDQPYDVDVSQPRAVATRKGGIDEAALAEFERIERLTAAALADWDAVYGNRETEADGEAA